MGVNYSAGGNLCSFPRKGQKHQRVVTWLSRPHHSNCISFVTAALLEHQALSTSSNFTNLMSSKTKARAIFVFTYADYWVNLLTCNHKITFLVQTQKNSEYKPYIPVAKPSITAQLPQRAWSAGNTRLCRARRGVFLSPVLLRLLEESQAKLEGSKLRFRGSKWKRVLSTKACRDGSVFYPDKWSFFFRSTGGHFPCCWEGRIPGYCQCHFHLIAVGEGGRWLAKGAGDWQSVPGIDRQFPGLL